MGSITELDLREVFYEVWISNLILDLEELIHTLVQLVGSAGRFSWSIQLAELRLKTTVEASTVCLSEYL
jgi:hypothetical protein